MAAIAAPAAKNSANSSVAMTDSLTSESSSLGRSVFSAQGLLIQLRAHHPTGCLLSELVQVYEGNYIVRALVQVDSTTIATAMAAANSVELAEDHARGRVLEILGIAPLNLSVVAGLADRKSVAVVPELPINSPGPVLPESVNPVNAFVPSVVANSDMAQSEPDTSSEVPSTTSKATRSKVSRAKAIATEKPLSVEKPILDVPPPPAFEAPIEITGGDDEVEMEMEYEFTIEDEETAEIPVPSISDPDVQATTASAVLETPVDLSDVIAQIGAEIDRIGWTKQQGSNYLQQTYNKRTRRELSGDELSSFLKYLKSLPSKVQPALSELPF